jgi:two-component system, NtrC family, response regulator HydG
MASRFNKRNSLSILIIIFIIIFSTRLSLSQEIFVKSYNDAVGPYNPNVKSMTQDHDGVLWFAAYNGIMSYDGLEWKRHQPENCPGITTAKYIAVDQNNVIWIVSNRGFVNTFDGTKWEHKGNPNTIKEEEFAPVGISTIVDKNDQTILIIGTTWRGIFIYEDGEWNNYNKDTGLPTDSVKAVSSYKNNFIIATNSGIYGINEDGKEAIDLFSDIEFPDRYITSIVVEYKDNVEIKNSIVKRLWVSGRGWIGYIENNEFTLHAEIDYMLEDFGDADYIMQPDYAGGIIHGSYKQIYHIDRHKNIKYLESYNKELKMGANYAFMDQEYNIWICKYDGVYKIPSLAFSNYNTNIGLGEDVVASIVEDRKGTIIFGHNYGYTIYDGRKYEYKSLGYDVPGSQRLIRIIDMTIDDDNKLWLVPTIMGVVKIDKEDNRVDYNKPFGITNLVSTIVANYNGKIIVGAKNGVFEKRKDDKEFVPSIYSMHDGRYVRKIKEEWDGKLYIGYGSPYIGLYVFDNNELVMHANGILENELYTGIYDIHLSQDSTLLLGTAGGLATVIGDEIIPYNKDGLSINISVYSILEDGNGNYWFSTNKGVIFWDGVEKRYYDKTTGFAGNEVNRNAKLVDSKGRVWIGTDTGVSRYDEKYDFWEKRPKPIADIVSIVVGDMNYSPSEPVSVSYRDNTIAVRYRGISYIDEKKNKYKYWMEGASDHWSDEFKIVNQPLVFPNLKHGDYRFHLQVCNAHGKWSDIVTSEIITIRHPLWLSWWVILLFIASLVIIAYSIQRVILTRKYAGKLEIEVKRKTSELEEHKDHLEEVVDKRTNELSISNDSLKNEINNRQMIQEELEQNHTHLESIINNVDDAIVTVEKNGNIISANERYSQLFNIIGDRVTGSRITELIPVEELLNKAFDGQSVSQQSVKVLSSTSEELVINVKASPLNIRQDDVIDVMVVLHDMTKLTQLQSAIDSRESYRSIIGQNHAMLRIYDQIEDLSSTVVTVLITGDSGSGKELVAAALHNSSLRSKGSFIKLNCAALPENILESELFGHVKGAFTGAIKDRAGRFELARGGTLFLDEIGEISHNMQVKLLRVLETGEFERVGDSRTVKTDARIISATNKDLLRSMEKGEFRQDLYYRLNIINITLPSLKERSDDIPLLVNHFVNMFSDQNSQISFSQESMNMLINYSWPGNVRELRNSIERAIVMSKGDIIQPEHLPDSFRGIFQYNTSSLSTNQNQRVENLQNENRRIINAPAELTKALDSNSWNVSNTAKMLNVSRNTLYRKIKAFNLSRTIKSL